jgi:hypothetical protein
MIENFRAFGLSILWCILFTVIARVLLDMVRPEMNSVGFGTVFMLGIAGLGLYVPIGIVQAGCFISILLVFSLFRMRPFLWLAPVAGALVTWAATRYGLASSMSSAVVVHGIPILLSWTIASFTWRIQPA